MVFPIQNNFVLNNLSCQINVNTSNLFIKEKSQIDFSFLSRKYQKMGIFLGLIILFLRHINII